MISRRESDDPLMLNGALVQYKLQQIDLDEFEAILLKVKNKIVQQSKIFIIKSILLDLTY